MKIIEKYNNNINSRSGSGDGGDEKALLDSIKSRYKLYAYIAEAENALSNLLSSNK